MSESLHVHFVIEDIFRYPPHIIYCFILDLTSGHSTTFTKLTQSELTASYESAASTDFVPYIVDPSTTTDLVDRILLGRYNCEIKSRWQ